MPQKKQTEPKSLEIRSQDQSQVVNVPEQVVFNFPQGLPAFEDAKQFVFIMDDNINPFVYMKCLDVPNLNFVCIDPFILKPGWEVKIPDSCRDTLNIEKPQDVMVFCVVTVNADMTKTTANLIGPIILNAKTMTGTQIIMEDADLSLVRFNVWDSIEKMEAREKQESASSVM